MEDNQVIFYVHTILTTHFKELHKPIQLLLQKNGFTTTLQIKRRGMRRTLVWRYTYTFGSQLLCQVDFNFTCKNNIETNDLRSYIRNDLINQIQQLLRKK